MVFIDSNTRDDDLKDNKFIKTHKLPGSQNMHFRPDRILKMDDNEVTIQGMEGSTNRKINMVMLRSVFDTMLENQPKARFLLDNWNTYNIDQTGEDWHE